MREPQDWRRATLSASISSLDAGVSVNSEDRPHGAGEIGILKTSALNGGVFQPDQNKAVLAAERALVAEPVLADSILFSRMNTPALVGESCYVTDQWPTLFVPDRIWQLKPRDRESVSMRWLSFVLRSASARAHIETHATGTSGSMKNLPKSKLMDLSVLYPPVHEQRLIAQILDTLDSTIRQTEAIIDKLNQIKQGLLHDLLTRGIDANGELRPPQSQAPQLYKESPLGAIPAAWKYEPFSNWIELIAGQHIDANACNTEGYGVPYFTGPSDFLGLETVVSSYTSQPLVMCAEGDLLVTVKGSGCGKVAQANVAACISRQLMAVRVEPASRSFWLQVLQKRYSDLNRMAEGGNIPGLSRGQLLGLGMAAPASEVEMSAIAKVLCAHDVQILSEQMALEKLRKLKSGLMDDLLTGRVRVTPLLDAHRPAAEP